MKKVICEYCGTVYDAEKGACSICGSPYSPENSKPYQEPSGEQADALAPEETPKAPTIPIPDKKAQGQACARAAGGSASGWACQRPLRWEGIPAG